MVINLNDIDGGEGGGGIRVGVNHNNRLAIVTGN